MDVELKFSLVPGVGAGGFRNTLPSLYGVGADFILLLDDDRQGRSEKSRYIADGILTDDQVFTLKDVDEIFDGKKLETLLTSDAINLVRARFDGKSGKKQLGMYLAEIASSKDTNLLDSGSMDIGIRILQWANQKLFH